MNAFTREEIRLLGSLQNADPDAMPALDVLDIILSRRFGVEYQPVVEVQGGEIAGYQASARFWTRDLVPVRPGRMFARLHQNPLLLFHAELEIKKLQIDHFPGSGWLMLDLDVDSFMQGGVTPENLFIALMRQHAWSDREIIVKIVENHSVSDACNSQCMIDLLQQSGTAIALEDIGSRWGMFSLGAFLDARVINLNGASLDPLQHDGVEAILDWLVSAARRVGVQTVFDGVSSCEQLDWARRLGVDCVKGPLFSRQSVQIRGF